MESNFLLSPIERIVEQVNPEFGITQQTLEFVQGKLEMVLGYILNSIRRGEEQQVTTEGVERLVRATLQPNMAQWAIQEGRTAVQAFHSSSSSNMFVPLLPSFHRKE